VSKSDRIDVSREVLETMLRAVAETRESVASVFAGDYVEQGRYQQRALDRLLDIRLSLEALCPPQS
jgi:hypothetical protein